VWRSISKANEQRRIQRQEGQSRLRVDCHFIISELMSLSKEQVAQLRERIKKAPAKEPKRSLATIIREMRPDLLRARRDKNWTLADMRAWLKAEGVEISIAALKKYLAPTRAAAVEKPGRATVADRRPVAKEGAVKAAPKSGTARSERPSSSQVETGGETVPRASSFHVRRDREEI
jgi:hypothetical protein